MRWRYFFVCLLLISGCGSAESGQTNLPMKPSELTNTPASQSRATPTNQPSVQLSPDQFASNGDYVIAKHAADFNLDPSTISLVSDEAVQWSSSALGCPKQDMMYMDVMTDGFRVVIAVNGVEYAYHANTSRNFFLCQSPPERGVTNPTK